LRVKSLLCGALCWSAVLVSGGATGAPAAHGAPGSFTLEDVLDFPFISHLVAGDNEDRIAWVQTFRGVRNVWVAEAPAYVPRQISQNSQDDGLELTQLMFTPDGSHVVYVRGGDHEQNWAPPDHQPPNATLSTERPVVSIWSASVKGDQAVKLVDGDSPAISARGVLAFLREGQVLTMPLEAGSKPEHLFSDRGHDGSLRWSPDGSRLAFVSDRADHAFIGIFTSKEQPLIFLTPSTFFDDSPRWSADGRSVAFVRSPGDGGQPLVPLSTTPQPWSIWVADATSGEGHLVWQSPSTPEGSMPELTGEANLRWAGANRLAFVAELDNWPHLYSVSTSGGAPLLLTPGAFMVEDVAESRDQRYLIYCANTGGQAGDDDRRHLFYVPVDRAAPRPITAGQSVETSPVFLSGDRVAFVGADARYPTALKMVSLAQGTRNLAGGTPRRLDPAQLPADFPADRLVVPRQIRFKASDGVEIHGQLFARDDLGAGAPKAGILFVHGGPARQMYLGWHNMEVYSDHYAVNQYLASRGFAVLSVNYRLGIGYGHAFQHPEHAGPNGAAEYQDVLAAVAALEKQPAGVKIDSHRLGVWGSSYGGLLTGLALARNSNLFKTGVDIYGISDWSAFIARDYLPAPGQRFELHSREQVLKDAWASSPLADIANWRSPVLVIHGDDDRNVAFQQSVDLTVNLQSRRIPYEQLVLPNETHSFMLYRSRLLVDKRVAQWLEQQLGGA
jgi:dipeptidyl aminopeptidase/acylaminoacyl peptidase